jgi:hypothetical protein
MRKTIKYGLVGWFAFAVAACLLGEDFADAAFLGWIAADVIGSTDEYERN